MPTAQFSRQTVPQSGEALKRELQIALENVSPLDDFIQVIRDLTHLENKYNLESRLFYERFQEGRMGDDIEFIRWANKYEIYQETKAELKYMSEKLR
jgi:hypothetical protein